MNPCHDPADTLVGDRVLIEELRIPARIGVHSHEKARQQSVVLDIEMGLPSQACFRSDRVEDTIDYAAVVEALKDLAVSRHFNLIEFLAEQVSSLILGDFGALWVKVRVSKIGVLHEAKAATVAITRLNARVCGIPSLSGFASGLPETDDIRIRNLAGT